jgi:hypothetical protein
VVAGNIGYRQPPVKAWQLGYGGWDEDLIFLGGRGAGRKSNPGGLLDRSFICKLHYEHDKKVMRDGEGAGYRI